MADDGDVVRRAEERLGTVLRGKYRLDRVLGVGGMASVYLATHRNQAEFAVKLLHPELSLRADVRTRFLREGYVANSVKHPGAVRVVDDDVAEDGAAFLVMELLEGATVEGLCERAGGRLPAKVAVAIVDQLLDVLCAAHAKGIVHRDIKPANLFVTYEASVKVLDFGIARARDAVAATGAHGATGSGMVLGTPAFMSPEQALAKASEIDAQTDVWAAGATLFSLVAGCTVHEGDNGAQLLVRAATIPARPLTSVAPAISQSVAEVVDRALAFRKADRWGSAAEMRDALRAAWQREAGERPSRESLEPFFASGAARAATSRMARSLEPAEATAIAPTERAPDTPAVARTPMAATPTPRSHSTTEPVSGNSPPDIPALPRQRGPLIAVIAVAAGAALTGVVWAVASRAHAPTAPPAANGSIAPSASGPETVKLVEPPMQPTTPAAGSAPAEVPRPSVSSASVPSVSPRLPPAGARNAPPAQAPPRTGATAQGGIPIQW
jgi:serine/threonine-protein kinase